MTDSMEPMLVVDDLSVAIPPNRRQPPRDVVRGVSLTVDAGQAVGLVGESGSGKSMTCRAIMRLQPDGAVLRGDIRFRGRAVLDMAADELRSFRAKDVAMIYQDPRAHTNPVRTIGDFLLEAPTRNGLMSVDEARALALTLLRNVGIRDAERRLRQYPQQLSGGLLQRVMIVSALMSSPKLILADEPTTALDVTIQSDVMAILDEQRRDRNLGMLIVTHDLDLAAAVADRLVVMYAGSIVESGPVGAVQDRPLHPYTRGLLESRPSLTAVKELVAIPGRPASAFEIEQGCVFAPRCAWATDVCRTVTPEARSGLADSGDDHVVACHRAEELVDVVEEGGPA